MSSPKKKAAPRSSTKAPSAASEIKAAKSVAQRTREAERTLETLESRIKEMGHEVFAGMFVGAGNMQIDKLCDFESYLKAGTKRIWAVYKACRLTADVVTTTEYSLQLRDSTEWQEDKWLTPLLTKPNDFDMWDDLLARWVFHMKLTGNAFVLKDERNLKGWPSKLWLMDPKRMTLIVSAKTGLVGYKYLVNGKTFYYDADEIIHWRLPHPDSEFWGLGEMEAGEESLFNTTLAMNQWHQEFYKKGASPSAILTREEEMEEKEFKKLKARFQEEYGGAKNAGKTAWLTGKWDYKRLGLSLVEMEAVATKKANTEEIFALMGVPLTMAGVASAANYAVSQQDDIKFRRYTVLPLLKLFAARFNAEVVQKVRPDLWFCWNLAGLAIIKDLVDDYKELIANAGMTPNELRDVVGLERSPDPLADELYIGTHLVPLALVGATAAPVQPGTGNQADNRGKALAVSGGTIQGTAQQIMWDGFMHSRSEQKKKNAEQLGPSKKLASARSVLIGKPRLTMGPSQASTSKTCVVVGKPSGSE